MVEFFYTCVPPPYSQCVPQVPNLFPKGLSLMWALLSNSPLQLFFAHELNFLILSSWMDGWMDRWVISEKPLPTHIKQMEIPSLTSLGMAKWLIMLLLTIVIPSQRGCV